LQLYKARKEGGNLATPPAELLAREEALLEFCEENDHPGFLAFWEAHDHFALLGYGQHLLADVDEEECKLLGVPILRRASGGGTVVQGPGCLNYTLVLPIDSRPELESITTTNRYIMEKTRKALDPLVFGDVRVEGHTDLAINGRKFSGNAQRRKRRCLLFHGSFLLNFDLELINRTLRMPQQQPDYRESRPHAEFITNLNIKSDDVEKALTSAWNVSVNAPPELSAEINTRANALVEAKYGRDDWNRRI